MIAPREDGGEIMQLSPAQAALGRTYDTTISTATSVTRATGAKLMEIQAISNGIFVRYLTAADTTAVTNANFDEHILADTIRHFFFPDNCTAVSFLEDTSAATLIVIQKA
jgi:hypothetical protein